MRKSIPKTLGYAIAQDSQTLSGSAFRTSVRANKETFHLAGGQPKIYVKTAESGAKRAQVFYVQSVVRRSTRRLSATRRVFNIRVGTARQRGRAEAQIARVVPIARDWVMDLGSIKRFAKQRTS